MVSYWVSSERALKSKDVSIGNWIECGGTKDGWYQVQLPPYGLDITTEEITAASRQKVAEIERCMLDKGYRYVGKCDSEITRNSVACREGRR